MYIIKIKNEDREYVLRKDMIYVVGRLNKGVAEEVDILLNDVSVSRKHAKIYLDNRGIVVKDLQSKYSTRICNDKIQDEIVIQPGTEILVGLNSVLYVEKRHIRTCFSGIDTANKEKLISVLGKLDIAISNDWDEKCTHLTVNTLQATVKVLHALLDNRVIVTIDYWIKFIKAIKNKSVIPKSSDYFPDPSENFINKDNLSYKPERNKIFENNTIVFHTEKEKLKVSTLIEKAGGKCLSFEKPINMKDFVKNIENTVIIKQANKSTAPRDFLDYYETNGKIPISINEIILAIVNCTSLNYCNPNFNRKNEVFKSKTKSVGNVVVPETAIMTDKSFIKSQTQRIIPETEQEPLFDMTRNIDIDENPFKKIKLDMGEVIEIKDDSMPQTNDTAYNKLNGKTKKKEKPQYCEASTSKTEINPFAQLTSDFTEVSDKSKKKRKLALIEEPQFCEASTSKTQSNPFASIVLDCDKNNKRKERFDENNPFNELAATIHTKKIKIDDNPFMNLDDIPLKTQTEIDEVAVSNIKRDIKNEIKNMTYVTETKKYTINRSNMSDMSINDKTKSWLNSLSEKTKSCVIYDENAVVEKNIPISVLPNGKTVCKNPKTFKKQEYLPGEVLYPTNKFYVWDAKVKTEHSHKTKWKLLSS